MGGGGRGLFFWVFGIRNNPLVSMDYTAEGCELAEECSNIAVK